MLILILIEDSINLYLDIDRELFLDMMRNVDLDTDRGLFVDRMITVDLHNDRGLFVDTMINVIWILIEDCL